MYCVKHLPEDFVVEELPSVDIKDSGKYVYFWLQKRYITTLDAVQVVADFLNVSLRQIGFAGQKDKRAVTKQLCSVYSTYQHLLVKFSHNRISLDVAGYGDEPIVTGLLRGNKFSIIVRDANRIPQLKVWFVNFFGEQRFSSNNIAIGRAVLQGKYADAVALIEKRNGWQKELVGKYLAVHPNDFVGALKQLPKKLLRLVIHSYQSWLWNCAAEKIAATPSDVELQMPGFGFGGDYEVKQLYEDFLKKDSLSFNSFVIRALPSLSVEAVSRKLWVEVSDLKIIPLPDKTILLQFSLPKGSYATEVVQQLFQDFKNFF